LTALSNEFRRGIPVLMRLCILDSLPLPEALQLRSRYSIAFYQMCCSWFGSQPRFWSLEVDEIREWLHIEEGELVKVSHLKSRGH
jgi:flagellar motor switch protein FliM